MALQPPTATGHPVLGSLPDLERDPLAAYLNARRDHGDLVRFVVGPPEQRSEFYGVFSPAGAQQVLATSSAVFRKNSRFFDELRMSFGNGLITSDGDDHVRQRRLLQPLFTQRQVAGYGMDATAEAQRLVEQWGAVPDATVDVAEEMTGHTLRVLARVLFHTGGDFEDVLETVRRNFPIINNYAVERSFAPVLVPRDEPTPENIRAAKAQEELYQVCDRVIEARVAAESANPSELHDMLSVLARARQEDGTPLSPEEIRSQVLVFMLAGHDPAATALTFALHLLATHPEAQARALDEVDSVLAGRRPAADDMEALPYLTGVIKESLRLYPAAPAVGRTPDTDVEMGEYLIPAGTDVLVCPGVVHRHPDHWEDPDRFDPDRFRPEREAERHRYAWFPFGGGPRACIGRHLTMLESVLTLAVLLQNYTFAPVDMEVPLNTNITLRPAGPARCKLTARL